MIIDTLLNMAPKKITHTHTHTHTQISIFQAILRFKAPVEFDGSGSRLRLDLNTK